MEYLKELGNYLFCSQAEGSEVGSIYFEKGRIRLCHKKGPKISKSCKIVSFHACDEKAIKDFRHDFLGKNVESEILDEAFSKIYNMLSPADRQKSRSIFPDMIKCGFESGKRFHIHLTPPACGDMRLVELLQKGNKLYVHYSRGIEEEVELLPQALEEIYQQVEKLTNVKELTKEANRKLRGFICESEKLKILLNYSHSSSSEKTESSETPPEKRRRKDDTCVNHCESTEKMEE